MFTNDIILILAFLGLAQGLLLSLYLFTLKKGDRRSNTLLALILFGITIRVGKSVLNYYIPLEAWQNNIGVSGMLVAAPSLWLYGITLIEKNKSFSIKDYLHFIPFILFIFLLPIIPRGGKFESLWNYGLVVFILLFYLILSWNLLYKSRFNTSQSVINWYRNILIGTTLIWFHYTSILFDFAPYYITGPIFYTFLIYAFTYLFLNSHKFYLQKYSSSNLDKNRSRNLFKIIKNLFETEHLFLEENITLNAVSDRLKIKSREVSQAINENKQQNFNEFVNHYRIEKAKILLKDSKYINEKIASVAYEVGFGNVTSFNIAFKKETGLTPSAFRKD
jgi:AraC-like DNA-binding protein